MHQDVERILFSEEQIVERCRQLGAELTAYYGQGNHVVVVSLLKGAVPFMAELIKHLDLDVEIDFMDVSSYVGVESQGEVKIVKDLDAPVTGDKVLLVEDIIDTGRTLKRVAEILKTKGAVDVKIVALLDKAQARIVDMKADLVGFDIPNEFVVGFGLDYDQHYRNLPYIGILKKEVYTK